MDASYHSLSVCSDFIFSSIMKYNETEVWKKYWENKKAQDEDLGVFVLSVFFCALGQVGNPQNFSITQISE
jgi:hypothetical protein